MTHCVSCATPATTQFGESSRRPKINQHGFLRGSSKRPFDEPRTVDELIVVICFDRMLSSHMRAAEDGYRTPIEAVKGRVTRREN